MKRQSAKTLALVLAVFLGAVTSCQWLRGQAIHTATAIVVFALLLGWRHL